MSLLTFTSREITSLFGKVSREEEVKEMQGQ